MNSHSPHLHRAVERARWLAEVAAALDAASEVAPDLCVLRAGHADAVALCHQLDALRSEVDLFRKLRRPQSGEFHPNWIS